MLLHFLFFIVSQRLLPFILLLGAFGMLALILIAVTTRLVYRKKMFFWTSLGVLFLFVITIMLIRLTKNHLIYNYGEVGTAMVTQIEETNNMYNHRWIKKYNTLLKKADGTTVETYFDDWPRANSPDYYPTQGVEFPVKYIPQYPKTFIILDDVESDYSKSIHCSKIRINWADLQNKIEFDPTNVTYKKSYADSLEEYIENDCEENDFLMEHYQKTLAELKQEIESSSN